MCLTFQSERVEVKHQREFSFYMFSGFMCKNAILSELLLSLKKKRSCYTKHLSEDQSMSFRPFDLFGIFQISRSVINKYLESIIQWISKKHPF